MKTIKVIYQEIESCNDCPHKDHTGRMTRGGAKPCCNHPQTVKFKGNNSKKRVIPYKTRYEKLGDFVRHPRTPKKIPKWCPLDDKPDKAASFEQSKTIISTGSSFLDSAMEGGCDATEVDIY